MTACLDPRQLARQIARLDLDATRHTALTRGAAELAAAVRRELSHPPGGPHDVPWLRGGTLRDSIAVAVQDDIAVIGSSDPVAVDQECGTRTDPPRPFLAPAAAAASRTIADSVAAALAQRIREGLA